MEKLTNRQKDVLDYIKSYVANHGYPPAVREIGAALGLNSPATIQSHITALEAKGYIKKTNSKYRSLEIVGNNEYLNEFGTWSQRNTSIDLDNEFSAFMSSPNDQIEKLCKTRQQIAITKHSFDQWQTQLLRIFDDLMSS